MDAVTDSHGPIWQGAAVRHATARLAMEPAERRRCSALPSGCPVRWWKCCGAWLHRERLDEAVADAPADPRWTRARLGKTSPE